jgi:hypothetical protein
MKGFTMAQFSSLEVTLLRGNVDENGGDFRTLKVGEIHEGRLHGALASLYSIGYEVVSAVVDGASFVEEIWDSIDQGSITDLCDAFDTFCAEEYNVDIVVAFLKEMPSSEVLNWDDHVWFRGSDHEDVVRQWTEVFCKRYEQVAGENHWDLKFVDADMFPDWMATDDSFWKNTLENIASQESSVVIEFNDEVYYFG